VSIEDLYIYDVTILNPTSTTDRYGADVDDWSDPDETPSRMWATQTSRSEDDADRQAEVTTWRALFPSDDPLTARSRLQWGDDIYEIVGAPFLARSPKTDHRHLEADIRFVEG
jgi:head-tail adaptor